MLSPLRRDIIANWYPNILLISLIICTLLSLPYIFAYYALLFTATIAITSLCTYYAFKLPTPSARFNPEQCFRSSIFGHRGCVRIDNISQGSKKAFEYAYHANAKGIECDIRLTKDLEPVVIHDLYLQTQSDLMRMYFTIHTDHEGGNVSAHATHLVE
eukprot:400845_1